MYTGCHVTLLQCYTPFRRQMIFERNMNCIINTSLITKVLMSFGSCHPDHVGYISYRNNILTNTDSSSLYVPYISQSPRAINSMNSSFRRVTCVCHMSIIRIVNSNMNERDIPRGDDCRIVFCQVDLITFLQDIEV
jgi:hypothetical protein